MLAIGKRNIWNKIEYEMSYSTINLGWINIQNKNCCSYIYEHEQMKTNALSDVIKHLLCLLVNFETAIYIEMYFWKNVEHFEHVEPSHIDINKRFHLHQRELALLQIILSIVSTTLFLKVLNVSGTVTVTMLNNVC